MIKQNKIQMMWVDSELTIIQKDQVEVFSIDNLKSLSERLKKISQSTNNVSVRLYYEGEHIEQQSLDMPLSVSDSQVSQWLSHKIHTGHVHGAVDFEKSKIAYTKYRHHNKNGLIIDILNMDFYNSIVLIFKDNGISLDSLSSITPGMVAMAQSIDSDEPLILTTCISLKTSNHVLYYDPKTKSPTTSRIIGSYGRVDRIKHEIERNTMHGQQIFNGQSLKTYIIKHNYEGVDGYESYSMNELHTAMSNIPVNQTSNFIPKSERLIAARRSNALMILLFSAVLFSGSVIFTSSEFIQLQMLKSEVESSRSIRMNASLELLKSKKIHAEEKITQLNNIKNNDSLAYHNFIKLITTPAKNIKIKHIKTNNQGLIDLKVVIFHKNPSDALDTFNQFISQLEKIGFTTHDWSRTWMNHVALWQKSRSMGHDVPLEISIKGVLK